jgi:hypothetical protein
MHVFLVVQQTVTALSAPSLLSCNAYVNTRCTYQYKTAAGGGLE